MLKDGKRFCDVCAEDIPKGTKYLKSTMPAQAAALLSARDDPGLIPTWTVNDNGTVTMDICLECEVAMGTAAPGEPSH